mgnify:FL=1
MIFIDSSILISAEVETDQNHDNAKKIMEDIIDGKYGMPVISDYVFDETVTVTFGRTGNLEKASLVGEKLKAATKLLKVGDTDFDESWEIFQAQKNTKFSFTDCTILSLMKSNGVRNIATFDKDFKKIKEINVIS